MTPDHFRNPSWGNDLYRENVWVNRHLFNDKIWIYSYLSVVHDIACNNLKVRGICGNFNKISSDDLMKSNGEYAETFVEMSESFTVGRCEKVPGALRECSAEEKLTW